MKTVGELIAKAPTLDAPHSTAYLHGFRAKLDEKVNGAKVQLPYPRGSVQADAFHLGARDALDLFLRESSK